MIVGTFAAISPSFMIGAHAQQYGMDQKYNSAMNETMEWIDMTTSNHMEKKTTTTTNPSIV